MILESLVSHPKVFGFQRFYDASFNLRLQQAEITGFYADNFFHLLVIS